MNAGLTAVQQAEALTRANCKRWLRRHGWTVGDHAVAIVIGMDRRRPPARMTNARGLPSRGIRPEAVRRYQRILEHQRRSEAWRLAAAWQAMDAIPADRS